MPWPDGYDPSRLDFGRNAFDVVVVGGGFTGLSAAYHLARAGADVLLLEAMEVGFGASGRNGGQVLVGFDRYYPELQDRYGRERARELWQRSLDGVARVERILAEEGIACDWERYGHLEAAATEAEFAVIARMGEAVARDFGQDVRLYDRAAMEQATGSPFYVGGLNMGGSRAFHPLRYARGLAAAAVRHGARIAEHQAVTDIQRVTERTQPRYRIATGQGHSFTAAVVVLATNAYRPPFARWLGGRILPVESRIIATEPLPEELLARVLPGRQTLSDIKMPMYYFRVLADGRLLFGGGTGEEERSMLRVYPELTGITVSYRWSGKVALSPDWMPHLGRTGEGYLFAAGYTGHGAAFSTEAGAMLAAVAMHPDRERDMLGPFAHLPLGKMPLLGRHGRAARWVRSYLRLRERWLPTPSLPAASRTPQA